ncbi:hemolysin family protein [Pseudokineococcus lusitanus]|uniref:CBS domain containing-hemolysin-like protein n=1 Tax=Pseudokineococcus lusitanus TaxID=763993 RepID=A0A3N1GAM4_9ACTN|nr:hemolysin family protein [Pseudokineococcus lusitanus]ROP27267.1 CBS domain containing-hemolysin-like protein [Pseudokineococcus lusitanus]
MIVDVLLLVLAAGLVLACGAFVAAEFSLVTINRSAVERAAREGEPGAEGVLRSLRTLSTQLSGAQLGITVTNLAIGFLSRPAIADLIEGPLESIGLGETATATVSTVLALAIATVLTMLFGELVPKNLAIADPMRTAKLVNGFQRGFTRSTAYVIRLCNGSANRILRLLGFEPQEELASARSPEELAGLVRHSADKGTLAADTAELVQRSLAFGDRRARDVMTPRGLMTTAEAGDRLDEVLREAAATGHSRFPVLDAEHDEAIGTVHVRHVLSVPFERRAATTVAEVMAPAVHVPDTVPLDALLDQLREGGLQMAVVVDEFGDVAGLVTLEDLVEELVGEVRDEHDPEEEAVPPDADGRWTLAGNLRPDEAGELLGVVVPEHEDYDTLGGLVTLHLERLPVLGDTVTVPADAPPGSPGSDITLEVVALDGHRIETVRVRVEEHHEEDDDAADEVGREERREQPAASAPVGAVDREQEGTR